LCIAEYLSVSQKNVHAYVLGEHGETCFVPWSIAEVSTINIEDYKQLIKLNKGIIVDLDYDEIYKYMRTSGAKVIERKGCTNYAVSTAVHTVCEALYGANSSILAVSSMLHGEFGLENVSLSLPTLIGYGSVQGHVMPNFTEEEVQKLRYSANALKSVIDKLVL
jgi:L-lactate dehydrogenase